MGDGAGFFLGWEVQGWGFDMTAEARSSVEKGGQGGMVAAGVCDLTAGTPRLRIQYSTDLEEPTGKPLVFFAP